MGANDSTQKAQLDTQNQLQAQQLAKENATLDANTKAFTPYLDGNHGFTSQQLAALNSSALDQNALRYNQATQATNAALASRGENGMSPSSGVSANGYSTLQASKAGDIADALRTVTLNNAQQGVASQFNAGSILSGVGNTQAGNVSTFGSGASNALNNVTQAQSNGFLSQFGKGLGSGLGGAVGAAATGGFGNIATSASKALTGLWSNK